MSLHVNICVGKSHYTKLMEGFDFTLNLIQPSHTSDVFFFKPIVNDARQYKQMR